MNTRVMHCLAALAFLAGSSSLLAQQPATPAPPAKQETNSNLTSPADCDSVGSKSLAECKDVKPGARAPKGAKLKDAGKNTPRQAGNTNLQSPGDCDDVGSKNLAQCKDYKPGAPRQKGATLKDAGKNTPRQEGNTNLTSPADCDAVGSQALAQCQKSGGTPPPKK
jgi:hypothetical protein